MLLTEDFQAQVANSTTSPLFPLLSCLTLLPQVGDLRSALSRAETNASRREAHLKQEIEGTCAKQCSTDVVNDPTAVFNVDAQGRLRLIEERSQETSMSVTSVS